MKELRDFIHDHPLTSFLNKEVDDVDANQGACMCRICGLPILSCPSYTCSISDCKFFLHKPCLELPQELVNHPRHCHIGTYRPSLRLIQKWSTFAYKCDSCKFEVHPFLVVPVEIKSEHKSHKSHPLVAICRETSSLCDACGEKQTGFFFSCQQCNFWIHQDCTILPSILMVSSHPHPFILSYSLSHISIRPFDSPKCMFCDKSMQLLNVGLYFCCESSSYAHVSCARSRTENLKSGVRLELIQLPDDECDIFPSSVIRRNLEGYYDPPPDHDKKLTIETFHHHPLQLHDHHDGYSGSSGIREACNLVCDACVQPINISSDHPFYRCLDCPNFLIHNICAKNILPLPELFIPGWTDDKVALVHSDASQRFFCSTYPCFICYRPCNGICYSYYDNEVAGYMYCDLECAIAPNSIKHASHSEHTLFRTSRLQKIGYRLSCCSSKDYLTSDIYRCTFCDDFCIHVRCALLPKRVRHEFEDHPLALITRSSSSSHHQHDERRQEYYCEFCEEEIDQWYWYYGCVECGHYFHINCIPSVGYLSKVKFGKTLVDDNIHPHHPLELTRMLTVGRHEMCGYCNKIIRGFTDEMAFCCCHESCDFWIHFACAWISSGTSLKPYHRGQEDMIKKFGAKSWIKRNLRRQGHWFTAFKAQRM